MPKNKTRPKTYIALVLDKSGSMECCKAATIKNFNKEIRDTIYKASDKAKSDILVSLVTFNDEVDVQFFNESPQNIKPLNSRSYRPDGMTAMYDAVGKTIDRLQEEADSKSRSNRYIMVIISDGMENSSVQYTRAVIANRIKKLQKTKRWTFTYLGANQDLSQVHDDLNIAKGNIASYATTSLGTTHAFQATADCLTSYLDHAETSVNCFYSEGAEIRDIEAEDHKSKKGKKK